MLENRQSNDEERLASLEKELEETILCGEEADRNYEEVTTRRPPAPSLVHCGPGLAAIFSACHSHV